MRQAEDSINERKEMKSVLREMTNGADGRNGKTVLGKVMDCRCSIVMETAELIFSFHCIHW